MFYLTQNVIRLTSVISSNLWHIAVIDLFVCLFVVVVVILISTERETLCLCR